MTKSEDVRDARGNLLRRRVPDRGLARYWRYFTGQAVTDALVDEEVAAYLRRHVDELEFPPDRVKLICWADELDGGAS